MDEQRFYQARAQTRAPKLIVFLIDESNSMLEMAGAVRKHDLLDQQVNRTLRALASLNNSATGIKNRLYLSVLGYGGLDKDNPEIVSLIDPSGDEFSQQSWVLSISQLFDLDVPVSDGTRQFVRSSPEGWTPMAAAIRRAGTVINDWVAERLEPLMGQDDLRIPLPAPVILNVTDGVPTDDDAPWGPAERWSELLLQGACYPDAPDGSAVHLFDGPPLLINIGTPASGPDESESRLVFPTEQELPPADTSAHEGVRRLWRLASPLHPNLLRTAVDRHLLPPGSSYEGRRLYASAGADWELVQNIFEWGTVGMTPH